MTSSQLGSTDSRDDPPWPGRKVTTRELSVPVRRALRTLSICVEVAVFVWRRYSSAPQNPTAAPDEQRDVPLEQGPALGVAGDTPEQDASPEPTQTVCFGLDGQAFEIDLTDEAAAELRKAFDRYITAGRRVGQRTTTAGTAAAGPRTGSTGTGRHSSAAIREWARAAGHQVSDRGPIPAIVRKAYDARHLGRAG
jgi:hypothetical protein